MSRLGAILITSALAALLAAAPASARSYRAGALEIADPWTRPAPAGAMAVGYMVIRNAGKAPVTLVSARSPLARKVTLHQTTVAGWVARMAALPRGLAVAAGGAVALAPGGYHLMLEGLAKPLAVGGAAPLTLVFSNGQTVQVDLAVQTQPSAPAASMAGMDHSRH